MMKSKDSPLENARVLLARRVTAGGRVVARGREDAPGRNTAATKKAPCARRCVHDARLPHRARQRATCFANARVVSVSNHDQLCLRRRTNAVRRAGRGGMQLGLSVARLRINRSPLTRIAALVATHRQARRLTPRQHRCSVKSSAASEQRQLRHLSRPLRRTRREANQGIGVIGAVAAGIRRSRRGRRR